MTKRDRAKILRAILPYFTAFTHRAEYIFIAPVSHVLRCIFLDTSAFDKDSFYVEAFYQPMCVPIEHITFNLGSRVRFRGYDNWNASDPHVIPKLVEALNDYWAPYLASLDNPHKVLAAIEAVQPADSYARLVALAHMAALLGDVKKSVAALDALMPTMDSSIEWQKTVKERSIALRKEVLTDLPSAQARLRGWEDYTMQHLGLHEFR